MTDPANYLPEPDECACINGVSQPIYTRESTLTAIQRALAAQREAVIEECAAVCEQRDGEDEGPDCWGWHAKDYARHIRKLAAPHQAAPADPGERTVSQAPKVLNGNDKAYWVLGWNECREAFLKPAQSPYVIEAAPAGQVAAQQLERMRHIANEWADMAINGLQWARNINEGISSAADALKNLEENLAHCRAVNDAPGVYGAAAPAGQAAATRYVDCGKCPAISTGCPAGKCMKALQQAPAAEAVQPANLPADGRWYEHRGGKFIPAQAEAVQPVNAQMLAALNAADLVMTANHGVLACKSIHQEIKAAIAAAKEVHSRQVSDGGPIVQRGRLADGTPWMGTMRQALQDAQVAAVTEANYANELRAELTELKNKPQTSSSGLTSSDFSEDQWWFKELEAALESGTYDQKRALAIVRTLLQVSRQCQQGADMDSEILDFIERTQCEVGPHYDQPLTEPGQEYRVTVRKNGTSSEIICLTSAEKLRDAIRSAMRTTSSLLTGNRKGTGKSEKTCIYPDCNCPFDAPEDPNWCAKGYKRNCQ